MDRNPAFNKAYWLAQPPDVRKAFDVDGAGGGDIEPRVAAAQALMQRGFIIDREIMIWTFDPYLTMLSRQILGFTWVPNAVQPASWANVGGAPYDPKNPLPGSIKVSTDIASYPPFDPPVRPPSEQPLSSYVGSYNGAGSYASLAGDPAKDGEVVTEPRGQFVAHVVASPFGAYRWYTKKA